MKIPNKSAPFDCKLDRFAKFHPYKLCQDRMMLDTLER